MDDLVIKMESIFGVKQFGSDQPMQHVLSPSDWFNDLINFLPDIMKCFDQVNRFAISKTKRKFFYIKLLPLRQLVNHLDETVSGAESEKDAELFTDELNYCKVCVGLCLRFFAAFFTWSNFHLDAHKPLLRSALPCPIID